MKNMSYFINGYICHLRDQGKVPERMFTCHRMFVKRLFIICPYRYLLCRTDFFAM